MQTKWRTAWPVGAVVVVWAIATVTWAAEVRSLRCEYRSDPLGVDTSAPRLSWVIASDRRGEVQTAYQVLVASTPESLAQNQGDLWDSGRVASDRQNQVEYAGQPLAARMRCHWKVRAWDREGKESAWSPPAQWTMGLLNRQSLAAGRPHVSLASLHSAQCDRHGVRAGRGHRWRDRG